MCWDFWFSADEKKMINWLHRIESVFFKTEKLFCFLLKFIFSWRIIFYSVVLVSANLQHELAVSINMSPPSWTSFPSPTPSYPSRFSESSRLSSLCSTTMSHLLSILYMVMYLFECYSLNSSLPLLPPLCSHVCSLSPHLYSCPANRLISTIFLDSIYVLIPSICFSLSKLLHSVQQALVSSASLKLTQIHSFLWLSNILLYICTTTSLFIHLSMDI